MKKLLVVLGVVALGFGFTSCKKECKCNIAGINFDMSSAGIDTKEDCDAYASLTEDTPGLKCSWE